jgi:hypothetical protein
MAWLESVDDDVFDDEDAGGQLRRDPADVQGPLHELRAFPFRAFAQVRAQVHREERHERAGDNGDHDREQPQRGAPPAGPAGRRLLRLGRSFDGSGWVLRHVQQRSLFDHNQYTSRVN